MATAAPGRRLSALLVVVLVAFAAIGARLVDVQARSRAHYARLGLDQRMHTITLAASRGSILDRNGNALAVSVELSSVWADPRQIADPQRYASQLAPVVGVDEASLAATLGQSDRAFVYVARKVEPEVAQEVRALGLDGVGFVPESKRYYPADPLAGSLLGFVGLDNNGLGGLEAGAESQLAGRPGRMVVEVDPEGRQLPDGTRRLQPARRGQDLVLTIDQSIQYHTEQALTEGVARAEAKGGVAIVMDLATGDVLAMASVDGAVGDIGAHPSPASTANRPVTDVFEPGSMAKLITLAAALDAGTVNPQTVLSVPNELVVGDDMFKDVGENPPSMTVTDIIRLSSNIGTILLAQGVGAERFDAMLRALGFGSNTGLDYPGETPGILLPLGEYNATSLASMPIGQGFGVTALQMLRAYATIANDGVMRAPRLIQATIDAQGVRHEVATTETRRVVTSETARQIRAILTQVVADGTGRRAQVPQYSVAGKTGTAYKPPYDKPPYRYVGSFVGFAPADAPRLAAIVSIDEPQSDDRYGGLVAAPVFAWIMQHALTVERVPASGPAAIGPIP